MTEFIDGLHYEGEEIVDTKAPHSVPISRRQKQCESEAKLVDPASHRKLDTIVAGSGLAGGAAAASLGEQGYNIKVFFYQDSVRQVHSITAQGGINIARNYRNDDDPVYRLFYDTVKGSDYRAHEDNIYHLAEVSAGIISQCMARGVPFACEYGGLLDNRSFGGVQVSHAFYAHGQTGQQPLIDVYQTLERQVHTGTIKEFRRHGMVELIIVRGCARGIVTRDMVSGKIEAHLANAAVLASGGHGNMFFLSTNAMGCDATAVWHAHRKDTYFVDPCYTQIHPTCIPQSGDFQSKLILMGESLRNDGCIWVPKKVENCDKNPYDIPEEVRNYYPERIYPAFGNLVPCDIISRQAKDMCGEDRDMGSATRERDVNGNEQMMRRDVYLDFSEAINRLGKDAVSARYGNPSEIYQCIAGDDPHEASMRTYPAVHYTIDGLWVDYDPESDTPGLYIVGEADLSDYGASRLGASVLMQRLADDYLILPDTMNDYLVDMLRLGKVDPNVPEIAEVKRSVEERITRLVALHGTRSVDDFHMALGHIMWEYYGMEWRDAGLRGTIGQIRTLREEFWYGARIMGQADELNQALERADRLPDFFELTKFIYINALYRRKSYDGRFRVELQTPKDEALWHGDEFLYAAVWE